MIDAQIDDCFPNGNLQELFSLFEHLLLLTIYILDGLPILYLLGRQLTFGCQKRLDQFNILTDKTQLFSDSAANLFVTRFVVAGKLSLPG